jgi:protein TonB
MTKNNALLALLFCASALIHGVFLFWTPPRAHKEKTVKTTAQTSKMFHIVKSRKAALKSAPSKKPPPPKTEAGGARERAAEREEAAEEKEAEDGRDAVDAALREAVFSAYFNAIRALINKQKEYPYEAQTRRQQGKVKVLFYLNRDGALDGSERLEQKTPYEALNRAALNAVRKAAPFPPLPPELDGKKTAFVITLNFAVN